MYVHMYGVEAARLTPGDPAIYLIPGIDFKVAEAQLLVGQLYQFIFPFLMYAFLIRPWFLFTRLISSVFLSFSSHSKNPNESNEFFN